MSSENLPYSAAGDAAAVLRLPKSGPQILRRCSCTKTAFPVNRFDDRHLLMGLQDRPDAWKWRQGMGCDAWCLGIRRFFAGSWEERRGFCSEHVRCGVRTDRSSDSGVCRCGKWFTGDPHVQSGSASCSESTYFLRVCGREDILPARTT